MKNKTPIQELIYWIEEIENSIFGVTGLKVEMEMLRDFKKGLVRHLPKEKQFAFDCFLAGKMSLCKIRYPYLVSSLILASFIPNMLNNTQISFVTTNKQTTFTSNLKHITMSRDYNKDIWFFVDEYFQQKPMYKDFFVETWIEFMKADNWKLVPIEVRLGIINVVLDYHVTSFNFVYNVFYVGTMDNESDSEKELWEDDLKKRQESIKRYATWPQEYICLDLTTKTMFMFVE